MSKVKDDELKDVSGGGGASDIQPDAQIGNYRRREEDDDGGGGGGTGGGGTGGGGTPIGEDPPLQDLL